MILLLPKSRFVFSFLIYAIFVVLAMLFTVCLILLQGAASYFGGGGVTLNGGGTNICGRFRGLKLWILERLNFQLLSEKCRPAKEWKRLRSEDRRQLTNNLETGLSNDKGPVSDSSSNLDVSNG